MEAARRIHTTSGVDNGLHEGGVEWMRGSLGLRSTAFSVRLLGDTCDKMSVLLHVTSTFGLDPHSSEFVFSGVCWTLFGPEQP